MKFWMVSWLLTSLLAWNPGVAATAPPAADPPPKAEASKPQAHAAGQRHVKKQKGKASYYSRKFSGKKMADGTPMNPKANVAASKTLPLGTKAEVKNLETGDSTVVEIKDRGPYVKDRIIDLSPKAAEDIDMKKDGVAPVEVTPLQVPKPGQAAPNQEGDRKSAP